MAWPMSRNLLFNFWTPNISETAQLKIQTSNFARGLKVRDKILNKKNAKLVKKGRGLDYVQHLSPVTF